MSKLVLYTNPQSRGRIAHWMMEEVGEPYDTVWLEFGTSMKAPEYLAVNPMGKVPAIKHGDAVITEAGAVCAYLAQAFPAKNLMPPAGPQLAAYYRWLFFAAGPIESAVTAKSFHWDIPPGRNGAVGFGSFDDTINAIEHALKPGPFVCGDQFTAADVYLGSSLGWGMMFGAIPKRPSFEEYVARCQARPAAKRAAEINAKKMGS